MRCGQVLLVVALGALLSGCVSSTLSKSARSPGLNGTIPVSVALRRIEDTVEYDDEGLYLQRSLRRGRSFLDVDLVPDDWQVGQSDSQIVIDGTIEHGGVRERRHGFGTFLSVVTLGGYYLLGGPTKTGQATVTYDFTVFFPGQNVTHDLTFQDRRSAYIGLYGARDYLSKKPAVYEPGWEELNGKVVALWKEADNGVR